MNTVDAYIGLGLALGRHIDGLVDAYYGPPEPARRAAAGDPVPAAELARRAGELLGALDSDHSLEDGRRRWLRAQVTGLRTTARKLAGEAIGYADEVELSYGVRPRRVDEDVLAAAHRRLEDVLPGSGPLADRFVEWREAQAVAPDLLARAIGSLCEDLRERTRARFGLPDGEHVDFELVTGQPWAGFNFYLGELQSRVAVNTDLPVLSTSLAHLVAHEAYPGHHTEHSRKEVGLVRGRRWLEESIFLVGTPQCLLAEGLADLGLEVVMGERPEPVVAGHLRPLGIRYDAEVAAAVAQAGEDLGWVRANAAFLLHEDGAPPDEVVEYVARWSLTSRERAEKSVAFLLDPTWRAYVTCYVEGFRLCRAFVSGRPERFSRLISEQLVPADLSLSAPPNVSLSAPPNVSLSAPPGPP
ncbi:MAG TPA: hypothetical protein VFH50_04175 [Acidimicrobiales bacterium]|nr:hypothetical protein [Acidimicrobiales bacterium]